MTKKKTRTRYTDEGEVTEEIEDTGEGEDEAEGQDAEAKPGFETVTGPDGMPVEVAAGTVLVRDSWLINPADVTKATANPAAQFPNSPPKLGYIVETKQGSYLLTEEEAAEVVPAEILAAADAEAAKVKT